MMKVPHLRKNKLKLKLMNEALYNMTKDTQLQKTSITSLEREIRYNIKAFLL